MKKRIGSKLYDTDAAICVLPEQNLYRQRHKTTFFLFDGVQITPVDTDQAAEMIREYGSPADTAFLVSRNPDVQGRAAVSISADAANRLVEYCRQHGVSQKKIIEDFIYNLPVK